MTVGTDVVALAYAEGAREPDASMAGADCPSCETGQVSTYCDGCDENLCAPCWLEHNCDAPCHLDEPEAWTEWLEHALRKGS